LYRKDRLQKIKTKLKRKIIKKNMGWCDDPLSKFYNRLVKLPFHSSAEKLFRNDHSYDIIVVISYNRKKIRKYKGSAIFIHIARKDFRPTKGCIAISKPIMLNLIRLIDKKTKIFIK